MLYNLRFISSFIKYLIFLTSISIFIIFCDSNNNEYTGPWKEVPTPGGEGELTACYFTVSDNGWACGHSWNEEEQRSYPLLIHWNGTEWEEYPYGGWFDEEGFDVCYILDISFSSPDDGWCVGQFNDKLNEPHGFILRYDGIKWYSFNKDLGRQVYRVFAISLNDVWFVVYETDDGDVLYHWDGNEIKKSDTSPVDADIEDLAFSSSNEGLAVGFYYCVYHWDGVSWNLIDYDDVRDEPNYAVSYYTPTRAIIVGNERQATWIDGEYKYWYHWSYSFHGVYFSSEDEGWMIGYIPISNVEAKFTTWHWDGNIWTPVEFPKSAYKNYVFSVGKNNAWIVGNNYANCATWHYEP
ncbi:MAG: hypothetical protein ACUVWP_00950 [bacterium]